MTSPALHAGQRGPTEHTRREQIIDAANEHFRHYGYSKTTVSDLAKAIGLSTAYIYKFFESKQAIGEAICSICLGQIAAELEMVTNSDRTAAERLHDLFNVKAKRGEELFFHDRKLHEIVVAAHKEQWRSVESHDEALFAMVERIISDGRAAGEFERKTPIDEVCNGILLIMQPFRNPVLLAQKLDNLEREAATLAALVLRSLAP